MKVQITIQNDHANLLLPERFEHGMLADFRMAYASLLEDSRIRQINIDCSNLNFIDSLGLGLLLVLREKASERNMKISLSGVIDRIRKILWIANFHNLFEIETA